MGKAVYLSGVALVIAALALARQLSNYTNTTWAYRLTVGTVGFSVALLGVGIVDFAHSIRKRQREAKRALELTQESVKNSLPEIRGEFFNFRNDLASSGRTTYKLSASVCNVRPATTSIHGIRLTVHDSFGQTDSEESLALVVGGGVVVLERGIERTVQAEFRLKPTAAFVDRISVKLIDSFGAEHRLTSRDPIPGVTVE